MIGGNANSEGGPHELRIRIHGPASSPTIVYLPGLHGDWTLIGSFRKVIGKRVRFIEVGYPDTLTWSLEEHAVALENALRDQGVSRAWLLGESFGSQVAWALISRHCFPIDGLILAGGFVRHPAPWAANLSAWFGTWIPIALTRTLLRGYARLARWRFRRHPETADCIWKYVDAFTENRRKALVHRLRLVAQNDFRIAARQMDQPVFALSGFWDPVVAWVPVRAWLKRNCPSLGDYKILRRADHNVLGTGADAAAKLVLRWMRAEQM
jgi:pimeloyl-ACP methyl ester carboxylesterase